VRSALVVLLMWLWPPGYLQAPPTDDVTSPEESSAAQRLQPPRTIGIASFSSPAYSTDGRALVEARYICGGLCGYGWFFLLERRGEVWVVLADELLFIS